jgi:hypothetical protein
LRQLIPSICKVVITARLSYTEFCRRQPAERSSTLRRRFQSRQCGCRPGSTAVPAVGGSVSLPRTSVRLFYDVVTPCLTGKKFVLARRQHQRARRPCYPEITCNPAGHCKGQFHLNDASPCRIPVSRITVRTYGISLRNCRRTFHYHHAYAL